jgi:hypothetical protein
MLNKVWMTTYPLKELDRKESLRYACCQVETEEIRAALNECLLVCKNAFSPRVCYTVWTVEQFFQVFGQESQMAKSRLDGCQYVVLFAGTVGLDIDRLVAKYVSVSPSKAVLLQAIGAERIECLCDVFCEEIKKKAEEKGYTARTRFSAGYGDFPLNAQTKICHVLDCTRKIGVSLTDSLLMVPTKSVTAFIGLEKQQ